MGVICLERQRSSDAVSLAARLFCVGFFVFLGYLFFKHVLVAVLPFLVAYILSLGIRPLSVRAARKTRLPQGLCAAVLVIFFIVALVVISALFVRRLFGEIEDFILGGESGVSAFREMTSAVSNMLDSAREGVDALGFSSLGDRLGSIVSNIEESVISAVSSYIPKVLSGIVSRAPSIFIGMVVTVVSSYYFSLDGKVVFDFIKKRCLVGIVTV